MSKRGLSILPIQNGSTRQAVCQTGACLRQDAVVEGGETVVADAVSVISPAPSREVIIINNTIQYPQGYHHNNNNCGGGQQYCYPSACYMNPRTYSYCSPVYYPQSLCRYSCP